MSGAKKIKQENDVIYKLNDQKMYTVALTETK